ncbi:MAG: copper-binding protein [Bryobacteraceae bacterium]
MTRRTVLSITLWTLALAGCGSKAPVKRYPMEGDVVALDPSSKTATIKAGKIGDWMEAMTMEYAVKPDAEFAKLKVGAHIKATVVVEEEKYYVTGIDVTAPPAGK